MTCNGWEEVQPPLASWGESEGTWAPESTGTDARMQDPEQSAEVRNRHALASVEMVPSTGEKQALVEMVIDEFWSVVNGNDASL